MCVLHATICHQGPESEPELGWGSALWRGAGDGQEGVGSPLAVIPRTVYAQTQPLSSSSSLRGGDLLRGKIPSWASPSEREEARGRGWDSQGRLCPPLVIAVYWVGFWERARLHQTRPEEDTWPYKLGPVNREVSENQTQTKLSKTTERDRERESQL